MSHLISCTCGHVIVKSADGKTKVSSKVLIFKDSGAVAICKSCDKEVCVPLALDEVLLKSMVKPRNVPLYVRDLKKSS